MQPLARFFLLPVILLGAITLALAITEPGPLRNPAVLSALDQHPQVIAHRGGAGLWPENTLYAFEQASKLGVDMLEMDLHLSRDGQLVVIHDATLERTTDGQGEVAMYSLAQLQRLDAGYQWSPDAGLSHPYRNQGLNIPSFNAVLQRFPEQLKVVEIKVPDAGMEAKLCTALQQHEQTQRVIVGSFHDRSLKLFRELCPQVATSAGSGEVRRLLALNWLRLDAWMAMPAYQVLQIPQRHNGIQVASPRLIQRAQERGLNVQFWTINDTADMRRLLDQGTDGLITDYPDRALQLLGRQAAGAAQ
jgi:glycerophosphoryl diester phosphodiesterase